VGPLYNTEPRGTVAPSPWTGFVPSSPLLLAALALFIGGYAVWRFDPSAGPGMFPLWDLLIVLGFVAGIGAVLSWFFASGYGEPVEEEPAAPPEAKARPAPKPRPRVAAPPPPRSDVGRPRPEIAPSAKATGHASGLSAALATTPRNAPPWDDAEDDFDSPPVPLPTPPVEPIPRTEVEQMLRELDGIERDAGRRRTPGASSSY
jgi:hypothetical protein